MQQEPVAAAHHPDAMGDEATRLVLARIALEILLCAPKAKQDFGNGAVALAAQPGIERAQGQDMPLPELGGHVAEVGARCSALEGSPEAPRRVGAKLHEVVQRQFDGVERRRIRHGLGQPELVLDAIRLPDAVPAIGGAAQVEAVEMGENELDDLWECDPESVAGACPAI